jgi:hypothetical protein
MLEAMSGSDNRSHLDRKHTLNQSRQLGHIIASVAVKAGGVEKLNAKL